MSIYKAKRKFNMNYSDRDKVDRDKQAAQIKPLIALAQEKGYLTYDDINEYLSEEIVDAGQIDDYMQMLDEMLEELGITLYENGADLDSLMLTESGGTETVITDEVVEEAAATYAAVEADLGRITTDPVRMYMREMGSVELLTRQGEITIAKRIE